MGIGIKIPRLTIVGGGGWAANGGRVRQAPQNNWEVNDPTSISKVLTSVEKLGLNVNQEQKTKNINSNVQVSFADLVILAGNVAIEEAARKGEHTVIVPFVRMAFAITREE